MSDSLIPSFLFLSILFLILFILWILVGFKTNFKFIREKNVNDKMIFVQIYKLVGGWTTIRIKRHPKEIKKTFEDIIKNPIFEKISKEIEENGEWEVGTPFSDEVKSK